MTNAAATERLIALADPIELSPWIGLHACHNALCCGE